MPTSVRVSLCLAALCGGLVSVGQAGDAYGACDGYGGYGGYSGYGAHERYGHGGCNVDRGYAYRQADPYRSRYGQFDVDRRAPVTRLDEVRQGVIARQRFAPANRFPQATPPAPRQAVPQQPVQQAAPPRAVPGQRFPVQPNQIAPNANDGRPTPLDALGRNPAPGNPAAVNPAPQQPVTPQQTFAPPVRSQSVRGTEQTAFGALGGFAGI